MLSTSPYYAAITRPSFQLGKKPTHALRLSLMFGVLVVALTGCNTPQPAHTNVPNKEFRYSFSKAPFISPRIIQDLSTCISDQGDQVVAINVEAQTSNRYSGEPTIRNVPGQNTVVCYEEIAIEAGETNTTSFSYQCVGKTDSGIYVLLTSDSGGGSAVFMNLLLVKFEQDQAISYDWEKGVVRAGKRRLLIRKLGEIALGDRWDGELEIKGNSIFVGKDRGWFAGTKNGGRLSEIPKDQWLKIDVNR
jgi:hypothetical protein